MEHCALIVESDKKISNKVIKDVKSLGHKYILCENSLDGIMTHSRHKEITYIIAGLDMADNKEDPSLSPYHCIKFIDYIIYKVSRKTIIVTANLKYIKKGYTPKIMRHHAFDVIDHPFPSKGRSLKASIKHLANIIENTEIEKKRKASIFTDGTLAIYKDCFRINGVIIANTKDIGLTCDFLKLIATPGKYGNRRFFDTKTLMKRLDATSKEAITTMINRLRKRIVKSFKEERGINVGHDQIIKHQRGKNRGYYLAHEIEIGDSILKRIAITSAFPSSILPARPTSIQRKAKIIEHIQEHNFITRKHATEICKCSMRTTVRDLSALREEKIIEFTGHTSLGVWQYTKKYINKRRKMLGK